MKAKKRELSHEEQILSNEQMDNYVTITVENIYEARVW